MVSKLRIIWKRTRIMTKSLLRMGLPRAQGGVGAVVVVAGVGVAAAAETTAAAATVAAEALAILVAAAEATVAAEALAILAAAAEALVMLEVAGAVADVVGRAATVSRPSPMLIGWGPRSRVDCGYHNSMQMRAS